MSGDKSSQGNRHGREIAYPPGGVERPKVFDRPLLRLRRERAAKTGRLHDFLLARIGEELGDRLATINRHFARCACLGASDTSIADRLARSGKVGTVINGDISEIVAKSCGRPALACDDEAIPFAANSLDALVSVQSLHWVNDVPGALIQMRRALRPDGVFLSVMLGEETLCELRQSLLEAESERAGGASPRISPLVTVREMGLLLQRAGFALPVADADRLTARYDGPLELMRDLRAMAATNALTMRSRQFLPRGVLSRAIAIYREQFCDEDGRIPATFHLLYGLGWAPHDSQQKPQRPGSARRRLAAALRGCL